jgi:riboflavin kinase / FMN adenylyltransferase
MSARDFMDQLRTDFHLTGLVVGNNFSLGHKRMGNIAFLQEYGEEYNIEVQAIDIEQAGAAQISSTRIRNLVSEGQVAEARDLLGHPVSLRGVVVHGDQRGRLLGFPTANVIPEADKLIPANGVYAARIKIERPATQSDIVHTLNVSNNATIDDMGMRESVTSQHQVTYTGAVNIGVRPTFDGQTRIVEAHLLDIENIDLYDQSISIDFIARLRSEQRFAGIEALKTQIAEDVNNARHILQKDGQE